MAESERIKEEWQLPEGFERNIAYHEQKKREFLAVLKIAVIEFNKCKATLAEETDFTDLEISKENLKQTLRVFLKSYQNQLICLSADRRHESQFFALSDELAKIISSALKEAFKFLNIEKDLYPMLNEVLGIEIANNTTFTTVYQCLAANTNGKKTLPIGASPEAVEQARSIRFPKSNALIFGQSPISPRLKETLSGVQPEGLYAGAGQESLSLGDQIFRTLMTESDTEVEIDNGESTLTWTRNTKVAEIREKLRGNSTNTDNSTKQPGNGVLTSEYGMPEEVLLKRKNLMNKPSEKRVLANPDKDREDIRSYFETRHRFELAAIRAVRSGAAIAATLTATTLLISADQTGSKIQENTTGTHQDDQKLAQATPENEAKPEVKDAYVFSMTKTSKSNPSNFHAYVDHFRRLGMTGAVAMLEKVVNDISVELTSSEANNPSMSRVKAGKALLKTLINETSSTSLHAMNRYWDKQLQSFTLLENELRQLESHAQSGVASSASEEMVKNFFARSHNPEGLKLWNALPTLNLKAQPFVASADAAAYNSAFTNLIKAGFSTSTCDTKAPNAWQQVLSTQNHFQGETVILPLPKTSGNQRLDRATTAFLTAFETPGEVRTTFFKPNQKPNADHQKSETFYRINVQDNPAYAEIQERFSMTAKNFQPIVDQAIKTFATTAITQTDRINNFFAFLITLAEQHGKNAKTNGALALARHYHGETLAGTDDPVINPFGALLRGFVKEEKVAAKQFPNAPEVTVPTAIARTSAPFNYAPKFSPEMPGKSPKSQPVATPPPAKSQQKPQEIAPKKSTKPVAQNAPSDKAKSKPKNFFAGLAGRIAETISGLARKMLG